MKPRTVREVLQMLQGYHQQRREIYRGLAERAPQESTGILLQELVRLEDNSIEIIGDVIENLDPRDKSYLLPGPSPTISPSHAVRCRCDSDPTFEDVLECALSSDAALDELIDLIAVSNAADSVQQLAADLRELERTKNRQTAKFTRTD